jgi:hypothetical protein
MADDLREPILARIAALLGGISGFEFAGRNLVEVDERRMPSCVLYDGDEAAWDVPQATGLRPGVIELTPIIEINLQEPPDTVGTSVNALLTSLKQTLLSDAMIDNLCNGVTNGGIRYVACTTSLSPSRAEAVKMQVHFAVAYPFTPIDF